MDSKCKTNKKRQDDSDSDSEYISKKECTKYNKESKTYRKRKEDSCKSYSKKSDKKEDSYKSYSKKENKCEKDNKCNQKEDSYKSHSKKENKCDEDDVFVKFELKTLLKGGVNIIKLRFEKI